MAFPCWGDAGAVWSFLHVEDAAEAAVAALAKGRGTYNVVDDSPVRLGEWLGWCQPTRIGDWVSPTICWVPDDDAQVRSVRLRAATPIDARRVARLHALSQRVTYGPDLPAGAVDDIDQESKCEQWHLRLDSCEHSAVLLAESPDGRLAGFGMISSESPQWSTVNALHVHPELHGGGIGRAVLTALVDIAAAWGRPDVQLHVLETNVRARQFYEHLGWHRRGTAPDHAIAGHSVEIVRYELR